MFRFGTLPFGLHNAPATWQHLIDNVLGHDYEPHVFVYIDDAVVCSKTFEDHLRILEDVLRRLSEAKVTVSIDKSQFCRPELRYLGYLVTRNGHTSLTKDERAGMPKTAIISYNIKVYQMVLDNLER